LAFVLFDFLPSFLGSSDPLSSDDDVPSPEEESSISLSSSYELSSRRDAFFGLVSLESSFLSPPDELESESESDSELDDDELDDLYAF